MAAKRRPNRGNNVGPRPEGGIRQSQMISGFGPGAMVDLVDRAVVIGGLEHWGYPMLASDASLDEPRLREAILPRLRELEPGLDLATQDYFRRAPKCDSQNARLGEGVRALEFPRWFVCQGCRRLARVNDLFEEKKYRYGHVCENGTWNTAVPVRFVGACESGHLSDFPWSRLAHSDVDKVCDRPELYLEEGATGDATGIIVRCANCKASRSLARAESVPMACRGERPWLGGRQVEQACDKPLKLLVRTATNAYFSQVMSALRLPEPEPDPLSERLLAPDVWKLLRKVSSTEQLQMLADLQELVASTVENDSLEDVLVTIKRLRESANAGPSRPLRSAEYERFVTAPDEQAGVLTRPGALFDAYRVPDRRADLPAGVGRLVIVPELREVRVQLSFSRFDSISANLQGEYDFNSGGVTPAPLTLATGNQKWLPAAEVRGEGVFLELDAEALHAWERREPVQARAEQLLNGFREEANGGDFPGVRFYLLHSLAHLLMTSISLECGYAASAIRERIYCDPSLDEAEAMAGILLSTGTTGAEGTLGGLVEEGRRLRHHLGEAWEFGRLCSNDPVCAGHDPAGEHTDRRLEGAACHGCLFIAESSCERFNRYLDRALVVPTIGNHPELAFFRNWPGPT